MAKLTIVILNYNTKDLTVRAIQSCLDLHYKDIQIIVVDNASTDGSVDTFHQIEKNEARVSVISLQENNGFAAGNNVALKKVTSDYVMLLNSDAYFPSDENIETALDFLDHYTDIGVLSPYVKLGNGKIDPASHRGFPYPLNSLFYFAGLEKLKGFGRIFGGYHQTWKDLSTIHDIDACTGAAMVIRKTALDEVGLLDERFFMYGEDLDWCFRFKAADWRIIFFPSLTVIHDKHSSGLKKRASKSKDAFYDAMKLFYKKHDLGPSWMENLVLIGIYLLSKIK